MSTECAKLGFKANLRKTQACWWTPQHIPDVSRAISTHPTLEVLGSPIGPDEACLAFLETKLSIHNRLFSSLPEHRDPQLALSILRFCGGASRITYTLRTTNPRLTSDEASIFYLQKRATYEQTQTAIYDNGWQQVCIPIFLGGLGLQLASSITNAP